MSRYLARLVFCVPVGFAVETCTSFAEEKLAGAYFEAYPRAFQARLDEADRRMQERRRKKGIGKLEGVVDGMRVWKAGTTVTVAMKGCDERLCEKFAEVAGRWTANANLTLSFKGASGKFRRWSSNDTEFAADIRIGFDHPEGGYFSLVGTQCRDSELVKPGEASMNLAGFDRVLPPEWESVFLHEFGHALGFLHEHQSPGIPCDFRMEDDRDYVKTVNAAGEFVADTQGKCPGVYTRLGGPPNNWSKEEVDLNICRLKLDSSMFLASAFDTDSIMKYDLPHWMFKGEIKSPCFTGRRNSALSKVDKEMVSRAYPRDAKLIEELEKKIQDFRRLNAESSNN